MDADICERVRERAHQLWLEAGCLEGHAEEHWSLAQREVLTQTEAARVSQPVEVVCADTSSEVVTPPEELALVQPILCEAVAVAIPDKLPSRPVSRGTPLLKAGSGQCRYIVSETYSPAICCGAPSGTRSWCKEHMVRVFARVPARPFKFDRLERR